MACISLLCGHGEMPFVGIHHCAQFPFSRVSFYIPLIVIGWQLLFGGRSDIYNYELETLKIIIGT
jgi:hypothetical protein